MKGSGSNEGLEFNFRCAEELVHLLCAGSKVPVLPYGRSAVWTAVCTVSEMYLPAVTTVPCILPHQFWQHLHADLFVFARGGGGLRLKNKVIKITGSDTRELFGTRLLHSSQLVF